MTYINHLFTSGSPNSKILMYRVGISGISLLSFYFQDKKIQLGFHSKLVTKKEKTTGKWMHLGKPLWSSPCNIFNLILCHYLHPMVFILCGNLFITKIKHVLALLFLLIIRGPILVILINSYTFLRPAQIVFSSMNSPLTFPGRDRCLFPILPKHYVFYNQTFHNNGIIYLQVSPRL